MERATHAFGPVAVGIGRLTGGAVVVSIVWWLQRTRHQVSASDALQIGGIALLGTALPFVVQPYCMARGFGHSYFGMMVALTPLATLLVSIPMLGLWPSARQLIGVVGGFLCMLLILQDGSDRGMSIGLLALAVTVPLSYALGNTYIKWKLSHVHAVPLTSLLLALAAAWLVPLELIPGLLDGVGMSGPTSRTDWTVAILCLALLGTVGTGVAILLFIGLVQKRGPLFAGMVTYVVPVLALLWGLVDGEAVSQQQLGAMVGVLAMVALVQFDRRPADAMPLDTVGREPHFCPSENPSETPMGE